MSQKGIFIEGTLSCLFQEYLIKDDENHVQLKKALLKISEMSSDQLNIVIAFSRSGLLKLNAAIPEGLIDFVEIKGVNELVMPSTQSELFIWAHSHSKSEVFDFSRKSNDILAPYLQQEVKQEGFRYHDSRDIMGFVDGSANPKGDKRHNEALIPMGQPHENGTFVFTQKWAHNLPAFHHNKVEEQERIIGRTKEDGIELEGEAMPHNSHVSRVDVKVNGEAMKIYRRSYPYANNDDHGLFFLGFAKNINRFDIQLRRMLGATEDKVHDKMMEFSTPLTGGYYFAPSVMELVNILTSN